MGVSYKFLWKSCDPVGGEDDDRTVEGIVKKCDKSNHWRSSKWAEIRLDISSGSEQAETSIYRDIFLMLMISTVSISTRWACDVAQSANVWILVLKGHSL